MSSGFIPLSGADWSSLPKPEALPESELLFCANVAEDSSSQKDRQHIANNTVCATLWIFLIRVAVTFLISPRLLFYFRRGCFSNFLDAENGLWVEKSAEPAPAFCV
jgi:hypothetical protein